MKTLISFFSLLSFGVALGQCDNDVKAIWARNDTAFVGVNDSLFRTFDGGTSWTHMSLPETNQKLSPREIEVLNNEVYVFTNNGDARVYVSSDWGNRWAAQWEGIESISGYSALVPRYAGVCAGKIYIGGNNDFKYWNTDSAKWISAVTGYAGAIKEIAPDTVWASTGTSVSTSFQTMDDGSNWIALSSEPRYVITPTFSMGMALEDILKLGSRIFVVGTLNGPVVYKTEDFGVIWENVITGGVVNKENGKKVLKISESEALIAISGTIYKTTDGGATWTSFSAGATVRTMVKWKTDKVLIGASTGLFELSDFEGTSSTEICVAGSSNGGTAVGSFSEQKIQVYPNPTRGQLQLPAEGYYQLFDVTGLLILEGNANPIDISSIPVGTYLLLQGNARVRVVKQ